MTDDVVPAAEPEGRGGVEGWRGRGSALIDRFRELPLATALRVFGLLALAGASAGFLLWSLAHYAELPQYALENALPSSARRRMLLLLAGFGAAGAFAGAAVFVRAARSEAALRIERLSRQLAPVALIGLLPFVFHWRIWFKRELDFGLFITCYGLLAHRAVLTALEAGISLPSRAAAFAQRAQAVMTRAERVLPPLIVAAAALGYATFFAFHTIAYHRGAYTLAWDLAIENNLLWNLTHRGAFMQASPITGLPGSPCHFGYHATLFAYVIAPFYMLWPRPEGLLLFQSVLIAAAALPLYAFAKRHIGPFAACLIALCYLLYPAVHGPNLYDFHYPPLGVLFLWLTLYLVDSGRYRLACLAALLTMSVREDVAADLAVLGGFVALATQRVRAGLVLGGASALYFLVIKMVVMPRFTGGNDYYLAQWQALVPEGEAGSHGVLMTVFGNPIFTFRSLLEPQKLLYFVQLAAPLAYFPWRRPIGFYLTLPGFFFTLITVDAPPLIQISFQYTAHWTAFLFVAVVANLEAIAKPASAGDVRGPLRKHAWLATIALMTLATSYQYGALLQQNTVRGGFSQYKFGMTEADHERYAQLRSLLDQIPPDAKVAGSMFTLSHASNRPDAYYLRLGYFDAEYLLFELPPQRNEVRSLRQALSSEFGVIEQRGPFVLARRGHPRNLNDGIVAQVR